MNPSILIAVAAGGAVGAVARFLTTSAVGHWAGHGFPWGTMTVNVVGSFALGVVIEISALHWSPSEAGRAFIVVGLLGAFTTFSTFSLDLQSLINRDQMVMGALYVIGSVALGLAGLLGGMALIRTVSG